MINRLEGKDCMIHAVTSAVGGDYEILASRRSLHLEMYGNLALDTETEAQNLGELLRVVGHSGEVQYVKIRSIAELEALLDSGYIFVGFPRGTDMPPHIIHVQVRTDGGFSSDQEYVNDARLAQALMEQRELTVYVAPYDSF